MKTSTPREQFIELLRREVGGNSNGSKSDLLQEQSSGTLIAKAVRYQSMDRMKGLALIKKGDEELLWDVEGDQNLIDRRLGGKAKRPREKGSGEEDHQVFQGTEERCYQQANSREVPNPTTVQQQNQPVSMQQPNRIKKSMDTNRVTRTPKRTRTSDPLGAGMLDLDDPINGGGPSRNTRSKAGGSIRGQDRRISTGGITARTASGDKQENQVKKVLPDKTTANRWKGKGKGEVESDRVVAEITAGIDGFSVFSNHQTDVLPPNGQGQAVDRNGQLIQSSSHINNKGIISHAMDTADWDQQPFTHSAKVGNWLEKTAQAGSPAPVDAPKSCAPSTIAALT